MNKRERMERYKERLINLARVAHDVYHDQKKEFNMNIWGSKECALDGSECGTTACLAGWAGMDPWFRRRGLSLKPYDQWDDEYEEFVLSVRGVARSWPEDGLSRFFGLDSDDTHSLFFADNVLKADGHVSKKRTVRKQFNRIRHILWRDYAYELEFSL